MKNKFLRNALIYGGAWTGAWVLFAIFENFESWSQRGWVLLIPFLFFMVVSIFFTGLSKVVGNIKYRLTYWLMGLLVLVDQGVKAWFFSQEWQTISVPVIEPTIYINPTQNTHGSYLFSLLGIQGNVVFLVALYIIFGFLAIKAYQFYTLRHRNSFWVKSFINMFISGILCVAIDNVYWGGSLDFIYLKPLYVFDIKDLYISFSLVSLLMELIENNLLKSTWKMSSEEEKELTREFWQFVKKNTKPSRKS